MATYDELMVYKQTYDLTVELMTLTKKMDKGCRFTLGERINNACVELLLGIYRINVSKEKRAASFAQSHEQIELVRLLLRLIKDLRLIAPGRFATLNEYVESISKQLSGWQRN